MSLDSERHRSDRYFESNKHFDIRVETFDLTSTCAVSKVNELVKVRVMRLRI
jgi:hypothetical protein